MKSYLLKILVVSIALFVSCGKSDDGDPVKKTIDRILIAPESIVQKTGVEYYVIGRYFKDYEEKDNVRLTVNGQSGTIIKEEKKELEGTTILFKLPPVNQTGDLTMKLTIDNGQNVVEQESMLRFVADYTLPTVWQSLDRAYRNQMSWIGRRFKSGGSAISIISSGESLNPSVGLYYSKDKLYDQLVHVPFIEGLSGNYLLYFEDSSLKELRIIHGEPIRNPQYSAEESHAEIRTELGATLVSTEERSNYILTTYKKNNFTLSVSENESAVHTLVTKE